jgi:hypothetical protein
MIPKKKRAAGGGRKPQGEFTQLTSLFAVRMPEDLREQLESAATKNRRSASQELLRRLYDSFGINRDKDRDPATRALCFLISEIAEKIRWASPQWHGDPFFFKAFKIGVAKLLDEIEPKGKIQPPPMKKIVDEIRKQPISKTLAGIDSQWADELVRTWQTPKTIADKAVKETVSDLYRVVALRAKSYLASLLNSEDKIARGVGERSLAQAERTQYGMADVRRDLELVKPETKRSSKSKS